MPEEGKKELKGPKKKVNPFCSRREGLPSIKLDRRFSQRVISTKVDKENLVAVPVFEKVDTVEEIQACKDQCGLEYMKKLIASGAVDPHELEDNAGAEIDLSEMPQNCHEAKKESNRISEEISKIAKASGLTPDDVLNSKQFEEKLSGLVKAAYEQAVAAQQAKAQEGESK